MVVYYCCFYGAQSGTEFFRRAASGRSFVYEQYHYSHRGSHIGPVGSLYGRRGRRIWGRLFYPLPMFVSLATHGLQAVIISVFSHYVFKKNPVLFSGTGAAIGSVIMVTGYSLGRAFIYSTPEYAVLKLPYQILQAGVGAVVGMILCWKCKLAELFNKRTFQVRRQNF